MTERPWTVVMVHGVGKAKPGDMLVALSRNPVVDNPFNSLEREDLF